MPSRNKPLDWSATAARELIDGLVYIAEDSPQGAQLVKGRLDRAGRFIEQNPRMGKPEPSPGHASIRCRKRSEAEFQWRLTPGSSALNVVAGTKTPYTLIYEEGVRAIYILHCWHQRRQRTEGGA